MEKINIKLKDSQKLPLIIYINGRKYINENELTDLRFAISRVNEELQLLHKVIAVTEAKKQKKVNKDGRQTKRI